MADPTSAATTAQTLQEKKQDAIATIDTPAAFDDLLSGNTYVVVDFHAAWCGPCRLIAPIFAQLATAHAAPGSVAFAKVDIDAVPEVASRYRVASIPTCTLLRNGEQLQEVKGAYPAQLRRAVEAMVKKAKEKDGKEENSVQKALEDEDW
ncbi:thioredoxin-like protein [Colletotrichum somersetense]|nr:thioredoxin-like protein [Colletotrichum somersetense]